MSISLPNRQVAILTAVLQESCARFSIPPRRHLSKKLVVNGAVGDGIKIKDFYVAKGKTKQSFKATH